MSERKRPSTRKPSGHELELWVHATKDVRPMRARTRKQTKTKTRVAAAKPAAASKIAAAAAAKPGKPPATSRILSPRAPPAKPPAKSVAKPAPSIIGVTGLDGSRARKLKRGALEIEARLDLHGATEEVAHHRLVDFIHQASRAHKRVVLVITGKGSGGRDGVLRRLLPRWLAEPGLVGAIVAVTGAARRHGGDGALYIYLRRRQR